MKKFFLFLTFYLIIYLVNTAFGSYGVVASGKTRKVFGKPTLVSMPDLAVWFPFFGQFAIYTNIDGETRTHGNPTGYFFAPLILLDRAYWHHSKQKADENGFPVQ